MDKPKPSSMSSHSYLRHISHACLSLSVPLLLPTWRGKKGRTLCVYSALTGQGPGGIFFKQTNAAWGDWGWRCIQRHACPLCVRAWMNLFRELASLSTVNISYDNATLLSYINCDMVSDSSSPVPWEEGTTRGIFLHCCRTPVLIQLETCRNKDYQE